MNIHKLGCNWGQGKPDFYALIKNKKIAISVPDKRYSVGDLVLITNGFTVKAIVKIISKPQPVTDNPDLKNDFDNYEIEYEEWVEVYQGIWYELEKGERFKYKLQTGIVQIQKPEIKEKAIEIYKKKVREIKMKQAIKLLEDKKQIILQGPPGTGKTYTAQELAYQIIFNKPISENKEERKENLKDLSKSENFELVQFHPSYTYEDFVRGISVETIDGQITYKTKNRVFGDLIEKANRNFEKSRKNTTELQQENLLEEDLQSFIDHVTDELEKKGKYQISDKAYIESLDEEAFLYTGDVWSHKFRFPFRELIRMEEAEVKERKNLKNREVFPGKVVQHATYFFNVLNLFREFRKENNTKASATIDQPEKVEEKKYVLIIDEINRANLPSVLGELIYALEYRSVPVDGMYEYNGSRSFTIPENLYIIGTMNTADRSVGHIDYAIRRRFAFIDVLPKEEVITNSEAKELFKKVQGLFLNGTLASDFKRKDVQLGHSYFLADTKEELAHKLQYEVIPILNEYVNDGILLKKAEDIIKELEQDVLR